MKTGFVITIFCFITAVLPAQHNADSLQQALRNAPEYEKANILHQLGKASKEAHDYENALRYYQLELEMNQKKADRNVIAQNLNNIGIIYRRMEHYDKAIEYYENSLQIKEELNDQEGIAVTANNLGITYKSMGKYDQALKYYFKALEIKESLGDKSSLSKTLNNIGVIFREMGDYEKALSYYRKSYLLKQEIKDESGMAKLLNNMGIVYEHLNEYDEAMELFNESIAIKEKLGDKDGIAHSLNNMGKIQSGLDSTGKALFYYKKSLELKKATGDESHIALAHNNIASIFIDLGEYDSAQYHLDSAIAMASGEEIDDILKKSYWFSAKLSARKGDYKKAYENYRLYSSVKDRLIERQNKKHAAQIEARYNFEKRERELKYSEEKRMQFVKTLAVTVSMGFLLLSLFIYSRFRLKKKSNTALLEKTRQLESQKNELTENRKELLKAKEKAEESDRLKSAFLANMSHEIRTPMNGILGFADLLKEAQLKGEKKEQYIEIIQKSGERMLNIINDLIDISKIESGQMETRLSVVQLNKMIKDIYLFFKPETDKKNIQLAYALFLPPKNDKIITDMEKLHAILINLIKNAIKYTDKGTINYGYRLKGGYVEFFVADTGQGIKKDRLEAVFERFVQADYKVSREKEGAGLGLSIAKSYVNMLGGSMQVSSEYGKGSVFTFLIPYKKPLESSEHQELPAQYTGNGLEALENLTILIAEDESSSALYLQDILKKHCKKLLFAETGIQALELFRQNPATDVILMDIQMPEMDGYTLVNEIRKLNSDVIIIAQTAHVLNSDRKLALKAGFNDHIAKPIGKEKLFEKIILNIHEKNTEARNNSAKVG